MNKPSPRLWNVLSPCRNSGNVLAALALIANGAFASDLTVLTAQYYEDPSLYQGYLDEYRAPPRFVFFSNETEALEIIRSGIKADVVQLCMNSVAMWQNEGLLAPWDRSQLPQVALPSGMAWSAEVLAEYADYYVPFEYGTTRLIYNSLQVPLNDVETLDVFTNPEYRGKLALPASIDDLAAAAFLAQGITDWSSLTEEKLEAAIDWLELVHPNIRYYWDDEEQLWEDLAEGEVLIAWAWNSIYHEMRTYNRNIALAPASSGASTWHCGYVRVKGEDDHLTEAHKFVSASLSDSAGQKIMSWGSGFANRDVQNRYAREFDHDKAGLAVPDGPVLRQTPMPAGFRQRFAQAAREIMTGS
ncbi:MAG: extracellular solute-binding protein [Roseovarius sp.]|uniref:extracellular solute-binding protein n=1 Tax=Roseovarius sp. TaxID=1486281 RepID=UPI001B4AB39E|nr:extracellular solute-binding protein [Roseovarius sp.]MBQ0749825.1 extracellular solute-binding protein [Roseovarius sp.]MBQ0811863.1 extracellular solute-binding protein [Roseovarius sp.]